MVFIVMCLSSSLSCGQVGDFNYDESRVPKYSLPDPFISIDGQKIVDAETWMQKRRPEVFKLFEREMYGRSPQPHRDMRFDVASISHDAQDSTAVRKQVRIYFSGEENGPQMELLIYLPKNKRSPVPVFLAMNFRGNQTIHDDAGINVTRSWLPAGKGVESNRATDATRGTRSRRWPVELILKRGYGLATFYYGDVDPDFDDGFKNGVHPLSYDEGQNKPRPEQWGSIAAWAWGLSRAVDYFETDADIDHRRVVVMGHSRLGKAALWAGACDARIGIVISNNSGCGGAALSRRRFGESVKRINTAFPHWFCENFKKYNDKEAELPFDQHMLLALIAPRPVYVASAQEDLWADPRGEFLSCVHAGPVYELLGKPGLNVQSMPAMGKPIMNSIGYHIRTGKHDLTEFDWQQFLNFADRHF